MLAAAIGHGAVWVQSSAGEPLPIAEDLHAYRAITADGILATPEGRAIEAVVQAAVAWHKAYGDRWDGMMTGTLQPSDIRVEADATLTLFAAVDAYLAVPEAAP